MNCELCNKNFKPTEKDQTVCDDCKEALAELTNGKGGGKNE